MGIYIYRSRGRDGDCKRKDNYKNDKSGLYILPSSYYIKSNYSRVEELLSKLLKEVEKIDESLKEIRVDIFGINQKVD